ncbi:MAG TPA: flagellar biosynthetic protein FliR [Telluria sp.]|nr:flagellar biosynthetic protein FliR [Telluria sp.]
MLTLTSGELNTWIAAFLWPLARMLGLIAAAPLFGNTAVPTTVKVMLGALLALVIAPAIPAMPAAHPTSMAGLLILAQEMLIGLAMGFAMRIVFAAVEMAGEVASLTMGLGFASFFSPLSGGTSSAISQFLALIATMAFVAVNGHLVLIEVLAESFYTLPVSATPLSIGGPYELARWGGEIFRSGLQLSLPLVTALLMTNIALGILTRAAPQLNLFGIGFPITLGAGFLVLSLALPYLSGPIQGLFNRGFEAARSVPRAAAARAPAPVSPPGAPVSLQP